VIFDSIAIAIQKFILTIHLVAGFAIAKCDAADVAYGSWPCKNSNARCARRNILEKLRVLRIDGSSNMRMDSTKVVTRTIQIGYSATYAQYDASLGFPINAAGRSPEA